MFKCLLKYNVKKRRYQDYINNWIRTYYNSIGQACEFDYSSSQAARSIREEGIEVPLINSNPATIMTDNVVADHIYLKPLNTKSIKKILSERKIDAVLPSMGGQTALNLCIKAEEKGSGKNTMLE